VPDESPAFIRRSNRNQQATARLSQPGEAHPQSSSKYEKLARLLDALASAYQQLGAQRVGRYAQQRGLSGVHGLLNVRALMQVAQLNVG
jgi:hypothetical protein